MSDTTVWLLGAGLVAGIAGIVALAVRRDQQLIDKYRADKMEKSHRQDDEEDTKG